MTTISEADNFEEQAHHAVINSANALSDGDQQKASILAVHAQVFANLSAGHRTSAAIMARTASIKALGRIESSLDDIYRQMPAT